jgi:hypothetical protein
MDGIEGSCGPGLADSSVLPARQGEVLAALAEVLKAHTEALVLTDPAARTEYEAYTQIWQEQAHIAGLLAKTAADMEGYRTLPPAEHDETVLASPRAMDAFRRLVAAKRNLRALLEASEAEDAEMLAQMAAGST